MSPPIKILLVDDIDQNLVVLQALLERPGLELLCANSGAQALELAAVAHPGEGVERAWRAVRGVVEPLRGDHMLAGDLEKVAGLIRSGELARVLAAER